MRHAEYRAHPARVGFPHTATVVHVNVKYKINNITIRITIIYIIYNIIYNLILIFKIFLIF